jgi:maltose O-acetyltransferase
MRILRSILFRYHYFRADCLRRAYRRRALRESWVFGGSLGWPRTTFAAVPIRIDGEGVVSLGESVMLGYLPAPRIGSGEILLQARTKESRISIGARTGTNNNITIVSMLSVSIGEDCLIGDLVSIYDCDFHGIDPATRRSSSGIIKPVLIGKNVWLGSRVMVLKGVTIGDNTVVAAGSVVTTNLPPNVIAGGVPAKVIRPIQ